MKKILDLSIFVPQVRETVHARYKVKCQTMSKALSKLQYLVIEHYMFKKIFEEFLMTWRSTQDIMLKAKKIWIQNYCKNFLPILFLLRYN